jgi:hypothetical protein
MNLTEHHAKYYAHEPTKWAASDNPEKFAGVLADARVDLNPYQVEAALFARNPFSLRTIPADEIGITKTIAIAKRLFLIEP